MFNTESIIVNTEFIMFNTEFIIVNTEFIMFNKECIMFNKEFIMFNTEFIMFKCKPARPPHAAEFIILNAKSIVCDTKFLVFNTKFIVCFAHSPAGVQSHAYLQLQNNRTLFNRKIIIYQGREFPKKLADSTPLDDSHRCLVLPKFIIFSTKFVILNQRLCIYLDSGLWRASAWVLCSRRLVDDPAPLVISQQRLDCK